MDSATLAKATYGQIIQFLEPSVPFRGSTLRWHTLESLSAAGVRDIQSVVSIGEPFYRALEEGDIQALACLLAAGAPPTSEVAQTAAGNVTIKEITRLKYAILSKFGEVRAAVERDFPELVPVYYPDLPDLDSPPPAPQKPGASH